MFSATSLSSPAKLTARYRILTAAHRLFYAHGIQATGVDRIIEAADVARMSFYKNFASKQALVLAFMEERHTHWQRQLETRAKAGATGPLQEVVAVFDALAEWFAEDDFRGCAFINIALELGDPDREEHRIALRHKAELRHYLEGLLIAAQFPEPAVTAARLLLLVDGAIVRAQLGDGPAAAGAAKFMAELLLTA